MGRTVDDDTGHALGDALDVARGVLDVGGLGALVDGVEGDEVEELDAAAGDLGAAGALDDAAVDGVLVLGARGVGGERHDLLGVELGVRLDLVLVDREFVGRERAGLVGAEDGDTGELLDGRDAGDDGLVLGELLGTDGHGDGQDGGHGDGDTTNQEDEDVVESLAVRVAEVGVEDEDLEDDEDTCEGGRKERVSLRRARADGEGRGRRTDGDHAEESDLGEDGLEVTGRVVVGADEGGGAAEEGVGTGRDDDGLGLTVLAGRAGEGLVALLLVDGERLAGEGGLVHRNVDRLGETAVGGADVAVLERDEVTGDEGSRLEAAGKGGEVIGQRPVALRSARKKKKQGTHVDLGPLAVTLDLGLGRERVHEGLDSVTGVPLLNETDGRVDLEAGEGGRRVSRCCEAVRWR